MFLLCYGNFVYLIVSSLILCNKNLKISCYHGFLFDYFTKHGYAIGLWLEHSMLYWLTINVDYKAQYWHLRSIMRNKWNVDVMIILASRVSLLPADHTCERDWRDLSWSHDGGSRTSCTQTAHNQMVGTCKRYGIVKYYVQEMINSSFMQFLN